MPVKIEFINETPNGIVHDLCAFAGQFARFSAPAEPVAASAAETVTVNDPVVVPASTAATVSKRKKAPAAEAVIEQPAAANDAEQPVLTIEDARERMKAFAKDGHMDCVEGALAKFGVKKVSDVDPDASGKPSPKFAAFVAAIEEAVKAKP